MLSSLKTWWICLHKRAKTFLQQLDQMVLCRRRRLKRLSTDFDLLTSSFTATTEVTNQFKQVFKVIDANGDGKITSMELSEVLLCLGYDKSKATEEAEGMVMELDYKGDGSIDLDEFMDAMFSDDAGTRQEEEEEEEEEEEKEEKEKVHLMDAFLIFDADKNGLISAKELRRVLVSLGCHKCSLKDCQRMIRGVDKDGDGFVDFQEFRSMMTCYAR